MAEEKKNKEHLSDEALSDKVSGGKVVVNSDGTFYIYDDDSGDVVGEYFGTAPGKSNVNKDGSR